MRIVFLGTPEFAVPSLEILLENGYDVPAVVTVADKPAGRGRQLQESAVKQAAVRHGLKVLQPVKLTDPAFLAELEALKADLQIVVAFRMLPEKVWNMPPLGTFNLHGSLLPAYRGAAPINRAIMNGETKTGVTTFFLVHEIDMGSVVFREEIEIGENESAGELHDRMMQIGAKLVLKTVQTIEAGTLQKIPQDEFISKGEAVKLAPKIFKEDCKLDFSRTIAELHNHVRGLSPYPGAFFEMETVTGEIVQMKVYKAHPEPAGTFLTHEIMQNGSELKVSCADGFLVLDEVQLSGKKRMSAAELLRGWKLDTVHSVL